MDARPSRVDLREFLEQFRQLLQVQNPGSEAELPSLLEQYNQYCGEANQRLRECFTLIQRGQYSNAVAVSEQEPNLLDLCAQLEIPERDLLSTVAQFLNVKAPTPVNRDLFAALQDAYEKGSSASENLKLLHRLTLSRAPLPTRLAVMRRLSIQNPNHPFMDTDIRTFERAWFKRAAEFSQQFVKQGRPSVIAEILRDLEEGGYLETPPSALIAQLESHLAKARGALLPELAAEIRWAYAKQSFDTLRKLGAQWDALATLGGSPDDDVKYDVVKPMEWVRAQAEQERKAALIDDARFKLEELMQSRAATIPELEIAFQEANALGAVDPKLKLDYFAHCKRMVHLRMLRIGGYVAAGALLAVFMASVIVLPNWYYAETKPESDTAKAAPVDATRKAAFVSALRAIEQTPADSDVQAQVAEARKYATTDDESRAVARLELAWKRLHDVLEESKRLEFDKSVAELSEASRKHLADVRRGRSPSGTRQVEGLRARLASLRSRARQSGYSETGLAAIETTLSEIEPWIALASSFTALREEMKSAGGASGSLERLANYLEGKIAPLAPDPDLARRAKLAKAALPVWKKALALQELLQSGDFSSKPLSGDDWSGQPPGEVLAATVEYFEMLRHRNPAIEGSEASKLKERLARDDLANLWVIHIEGAGRWALSYTKNPPPAGAGVVKVDVVRGGDGRVDRNVSFPSSRRVTRAPQSEFAKLAVNRLLEPHEAETWDDRLAETYDALMESEGMDPLLRLDLARTFLRLAEHTSVGYRDILKTLPGYTEIMARSADIAGNWLDAGLDDELAAKRERAASYINKAPRLRDHAARAAAFDVQRQLILKRGLTVCGWVCRDEQAELTLGKFAGTKPPAVSRLYTITEEKWIDLGTVSSDGKSINLNPIAEEYVGWPVFAVLSTK